jgi:hypothetical protein
MADDVPIRPRGSEEEFMERPSQDLIKRMQDDTRGRLYSKLELIEESYEANKPAFEARRSGMENWCTGKMHLTSVIINTGIKINDIEFNDFDQALKFKGTSWGVGLGYGTSFGTGMFNYEPSTLIGMKVNIELFFIIAGGGIIQTTFWDEGRVIGAMDFLGGGGGAGVFWGSGKFSKE